MTFWTELLVGMHIVSLALWFGGLFGYLVIVWPAIMRDGAGRFPRGLLARVAMRTAPWIYLAMVSALVTFVAIWIGDVPLRVQPAPAWMGVYGLLLLGVIVNNIYGSLAAWPRMMLLPEPDAQDEWWWFRARMAASLVVGLTLHTVAVVAT